MPEQGKILIADEDALFLCTIQTVLEQEGYLCRCTTDVGTVVELATNDAYDLLIADIRMPNGARLEWIPALQSTANLPIILTTGLPCLESALRAIQFQVAAYLVKPFEVPLLSAEVRRAIARGRIARITQKIQKRWQERSEELQEVVAYKDAALWTSGPAVELLLTTVLDDLSHSFSILQELRTILDYQRGKTPVAPLLHAPSRVTAAIPARPENAVSSTWAPFQKQQEQRDLPHHLSQGVETQRLANQLTQSPSQGRFLPSMSEKICPVQVQAQLQQLSRRERDVLRLLLTNQKPKTIANTLFISAHTVRNHLRSIFDKLSVHSQTELLMLLGQYSTYADL